MRIEWSRLTLRDFKEYRGRHVLDIAKLGNGLQYVRGQNLVDTLGSNGAGKSTLWDAFLWCLTGRTTRGLRGTDVRTWEGKANADVTLSFRIDGKLHKVRRSTEKNGLWLDGEITSQDAIDRLIRLTAINLPHTLVLGQKRDLFFDLKPADKLQILSETCNLDRWDERAKRAGDAAKEVGKQIDGLEANLQLLSSQLAGEENSLEDMQRKSRDWETERSSGAGDREKRIKGLEKSRADAVKEQGTHDLAYDGAETELRALRGDLQKKHAEHQEIVARVAKYKAERDQTKKTLADLKQIPDVCPTCGQKIMDREEARKHANAEAFELSTALDLARTRFRKWAEKRDEMNETILRLRKAELDFGTKSDMAKDKYDHLTKHIADIDQQIAVLKAQDRSDEQNPYEETVRNIRSSIKSLRREINETKDDQERLSRREVRTKYWVEGFKLVRLYLLQEILEELQEVTQNMLPAFGLNGWIVEYDIERETKTGTISTGLNVRILKPGMSKAIKWESWSGGENQRLLIVGALALSEVLLRHAGVDCDFIVLDEPTRHMSKEGIGDVVEHLLELGRDRPVFFTDHATVESSRFAHTITVTKDANGSSLNVA